MGKDKLFFETDEFKALHQEWTAKLKDSGFEDIERGEDTVGVRPQVIRTKKSQYVGGGDYFDLCQSILRDHRFDRTIDRVIFELHTEGKSIRDIEEHLNKTSMRKLKKDAISDVIKRTKETFLKGCR